MERRHVEAEEMATLTDEGKVIPDRNRHLAAYGYKELVERGADHGHMLCPCLAHEGQGCYILLS